MEESPGTTLPSRSAQELCRIFPISLLRSPFKPIFARLVVWAQGQDMLAQFAACRPHHRCRIGPWREPIGHSSKSGHVAWQPNFFFPRLHKNCPIAPKPTHEKSQLKNHVVTGGGPLCPPNGSLIFGMSYGNGEVRPIHLVFQALDCVARNLEHAVRPEHGLKVVMRKRALYFPRDWQRLSR